MREIDSLELELVAGGDHWGYEGTDGKVPSYLESWAASSYQNLDGSWGPTDTTNKFCYELGLGSGSSVTCITSDGRETVDTCVGGGLSIKIGGTGVSAKASACTESSRRY